MIHKLKTMYYDYLFSQACKRGRRIVMLMELLSELNRLPPTNMIMALQINRDAKIIEDEILKLQRMSLLQLLLYRR